MCRAGVVPALVHVPLVPEIVTASKCQEVSNLLAKLTSQSSTFLNPELMSEKFITEAPVTVQLSPILLT